MPHTVLFAHVAVVPGGLAADDSPRMPQPRETRRRGPGKVSQAPVLAEAANGQVGSQNKQDDLQAP